MYFISTVSFFFFFNDTATTEIYTLSLHDRSSDLRVGRALGPARPVKQVAALNVCGLAPQDGVSRESFLVVALIRFVFLVDRKSTRLNSSHANISYAVFCLKKKTNTK